MKPNQKENLMKHGILIHEVKDDVGVAVMDLAAGAEIGVVSLEGEFVSTVKLATDVPLGHKVAMRELPLDHKIIEYGRPIGKATAAIPAGAHVHVHNIKSLRW
jgi:(2R)-sulfolactate sulfo-lyase subunit alpha